MKKLETKFIDMIEKVMQYLNRFPSHSMVVEEGADYPAYMFIIRNDNFVLVSNSSVIHMKIEGKDIIYQTTKKDYKLIYNKYFEKGGKCTFRCDNLDSFYEDYFALETKAVELENGIQLLNNFLKKEMLRLL